MLTIVRNRTWAFDLTVFDTYVAEGDPGNVPTNHTGWSIRSQIRTRVGNKLVANLNVTFPVPTAGTIAIRHEREFTRSLSPGDYWWDIVATDPAGDDHVYVEPEPIAVRDHPTDPANATYSFVPGGGGVISHTHSISDITGLQAILDGKETAGAAAAAQAFSIQRANHTGTQAQSTIVNLVSDLAAKASLAGNNTFTGQQAFTDATTWSYTSAAASAHRTALGLGTGDSPTFAGATFAGLIEQRNGLNQQESRIYGTYTDTSNYRRLAMKMSTAGVAQIVAEGAGSGSVGNVLELVNPSIGHASGSSLTLVNGYFSQTGVNLSDWNGYFGWTSNSKYSHNSSTKALVLLFGGSQLLNFGGSTSSFPALKRNGTAINIRLADDSADAPLTASNITASGTVTGASGAFGNWTLGFDILATTPGGSVQVSGVGSFRFGGTGERIYNSGSAIKIRNAANTLDAALTCSDLTASGTVKTGGYTFATLPTPTTGMRAYITDGAASPVYMANAAGGGSTVTPVFYNGTNWINA